MTYTTCKANDCIAVKLPFLSDIPISPRGVKLLDKKCVFTVPDVRARRLYRSPVREEEEEEEVEEEEEEDEEEEEEDEEEEEEEEDEEEEEEDEEDEEEEEEE